MNLTYSIIFTLKKVYRFCKRYLILRLLILFFAIKLLSILFLSFTNVTINEDEKTKLKWYSNRLKDSNISTKNYLNDYNLKEKKLANLLAKRNDKNKAIKTIIENGRNIKNLQKSEYLIIEFSKFFYQSKFCHLFDSPNDLAKAKEIIFLKECPYRNCVFSCDKSKIAGADAVLFYDHDLLKESTENSYYLRKYYQTLKSRSDQIWILWNDEPNKVNHLLDRYQMNWTMSYRLDSEVSDCAYGCTYSLNNKQQISNETKEAFNTFKSNMEKEFGIRSDRAVWFVSNCYASFRLKFGLDLQKYFPFNIHGKCRDYFNFRKSFNLSYALYSIGQFFYDSFWYMFRLRSDDSDKCSRNSNCELKELNENKFYLSFESKNCTDYITEKLWRVLNAFMIPIVIQPSRQYYELVLPKDSFIHAEDFGFDPIKLAEYLRLISSNFKLYMKHHLWRLDYESVYSAIQCEQRRFCEMCTKLNEEKNSIYYKHVSNWFNNGCFKA